MFPDLLMDLKIKTSEAPLFSLHPELFTLQVKADIEAEALLKNGTHMPLFTIRAVSTLH